MTSPLLLHGKGTPRVPRHTCAHDPKTIIIAATQSRLHRPSATMIPTPIPARPSPRRPRRVAAVPPPA